MAVVQFVPADEHVAVQLLKILNPGATAFNLRPFAEAPGANAKPRKHNTVPLADVPALIVQCDKEKRGLFVVVNEGGDTDASITRTRAVFCDFDGKAHVPEGVTWEIADDDQIEAAMAACLDRALMAHKNAGRETPISDGWPCGSAILRSGHGFHVYWFVDDVPPAEFGPLQRALAARFGSDPAVSNLSRVMRLPGSRNWKGGDGVGVEAMRIAPERRYTAKRLVEGLGLVLDPPAPVSAPEKPETPENVAEARSALKSIDADCSRDRWLSVLMALRSTGWTCAEDMAREWSASAPDRYDEAAFAKAWADGRERAGEGPRRTLATVFHYAKAEGWRSDCGSFDGSDDALACQAASALEDRAMCVRGVWYAWEGSHWRQGAVQVEAWLKEWAADRAAAHTSAAVRNSNDKRADFKSKAYARLRNVNKQKNVLDAMRVMLNVDPAGLDRDPYLLACANGAVDLRTGTLRPADPEDRITKNTGVAYQADAQCPSWDAFLRFALPDPEVRGWFHRYLGYATTGDPREEKMMMAIGCAGSGKSTALNAVLHALGGYAVAVSPALFSRATFKRDANEHTAALIPLIGARLIALNETAKGEVYDNAVFCQIVSTEPVPMRRSGGTDQFTVKPTWHAWVRGNHRPGFTSTAGAIARRLGLVEFTQAPDHKDPHLDKKLRAEAPGILRWLVEGCLAWQRDRLEFPRVMRETVASYLSDLDVFGQRVEENIELGGFMTRRAAQACYSRWLIAQGGDPRRDMPSPQAFSAAMNERGFRPIKQRGVRGWRCTLIPDGGR